ncbi:MAG: hypothetical protein ACFFCD_04210 [Promethearchaeota archaeon]
MDEIYSPEKWKGFFKPYKILCELFLKEKSVNIVDTALMGRREVFNQNFETANQIYRGITKDGRIPYYW